MCCASTLHGMVLYKLFWTYGSSSLAGVRNPMKSKRLRRELGPVNPMESILEKGAGLQPPTQAAFQGFVM